MKKRVVLRLSLIGIFLLIVIIPFILAAYTPGEPRYNVEKMYGKSGNVRGWVNMSFEEQPSNTFFSDGETEISLLDLLESDTKHVYSCNPLNCETDYSAKNGGSSKSFSLSSGESKVYGLVLTGNVQSVESLDFKLDSNAPISDKSQIKIDILDDGKIDMINNKSCQGANCANAKNYGCYTSGPITEEYDIESGKQYCHRINLSESPGFSLGAWVRKVSGSVDLEMGLYDGSSGNQLADCELPEVTSTTGTEVFCDVNYAVKEKEDYYICLSPTSSNVGNFRLRGYSVTNGCGFVGDPISPPSYPQAYQLFAEGKKFDTPGTLDITNDRKGESDLNDIVFEYISERYGGFDCTNECVVPIRFTSTSNQDITLKGLSLRYRKDGGLTTQPYFYDVTETPALINSNFQRIFLDKANFLVPNKIGLYDFELEFDGDEIISEELNVTNLPAIVSLKPIKTASSYPTVFTVETDSPSQVERYFWDFGDGSIEKTTLENKITHTYTSIGTYELKVTTVDVRDLSSSKTFQVNVTSPRDLINSTLIKMRKDIANINIDIENFSPFTQQGIKDVLKIEESLSEIDRLEAAFNSVTSETQYDDIIVDLLKLKVPESVSEGDIALDISFFTDKGNIDLSVIKAIAGGDYDISQEDGYKNGVLAWNQQNLDAKVSFTEIIGEYDGYVEPILKVYDMTISEKKDISDNYFFIVKDIENIMFSQGTLSEKSGNHVYVDLGRTNSFSISTTNKEVDFLSLPGFISPSLNSISVVEVIEPVEDNSKITIFILLIFLLVVIAFIVYIFLHRWYKKKYEDYLFKNKNDLFNMVTYVNHAKKRGMKKDDIESNLRKNKWSSEQIKYVMKKYVGKRTGLVDIPLVEFVEKKLYKK